MKVLCGLFIFVLGIAGASRVNNWDTAVHRQLDPFRSSVIPERVELYADSPDPIDFRDPQLVRFILSLAHYHASSQVTRNLMDQLVTAVKVADPVSIRQVVECSLCHKHLNVDTLATLECDHTFHKACYMDYSEIFPDRVRCPLCRKIVSREPGNGQSFLFNTLRLFEEKQYILPLQQLFADSPSGIDFRDVQLVKFFSSTNTDRMKPGVLKATISDMKSAVEDHNIDLLRKLLECPICHDYYNFRSVARLECGHTMHNQCLMELLDNRLLKRPSCPLCRREFSRTPPFRRTVLSETLEILEAKKYIMPRMTLFPDSPGHITLNNSELGDLISSANLEQEGSDYSKAVNIVSAVKEGSLDDLREFVTCLICRKPHTVDTLVTLNCHHSMHLGCYMRHRLTATSCPRCHSLGPHVPLMRPSFLRNVVVLLETEKIIRRSDEVYMPTENELKTMKYKADEERLERLLLAAYLRRFEGSKYLASVRALTQCPICMESMDLNTFVKLECGHCFHKQCVSHHRCPICTMMDDRELGDAYFRAHSKDDLTIIFRFISSY